MRERVTAVFGSSSTPEDHPEYAEARLLGQLLAERGFTVASGGYGGTMEAVSRGAKEAGGRTIGVTCAVFTGRGSANRYIDKEIYTQTLFERIQTVIGMAGAFIALPGGPGTLAEVAIAWNLLQRRVIPPGPLVVLGPDWGRVLGDFGRTRWVRPQDLELLRFAADARRAVEIVDGSHRNGASTA